MALASFSASLAFSTSVFGVSAAGVGLVSPIGWVAVGLSSAFTTDGWDATKAAPKTATLAKLVKMIFFLSIFKCSFFKS